MAETLEEALAKLQKKLEQPIPQVLEKQDTSIQTNIRELATIVLGIVQAELKNLSDNNPTPTETNGELSILYKNALRNHYLKMITTLNAALEEKDPEKLGEHAEKLKKLAGISKPALQSVLYTLAGLFVYMAALAVAAQIGPLIALAPATYGGSLAATVPVSIAARKMQQKGDDFFSEGEKHYNDAWAIQKTQKKIDEHKKKSRSNSR